MQDKADKLSDRIEQKAIADCAYLYADVMRRVQRRMKPLFQELEALESKKPPAAYDTPEQQEKWLEGERRRLIRKSGLANIVARELAAAGNQCAVVIKKAMDDIDKVNRVGDDIG